MSGLPVEEVAQYMIDEGLMPWEEDEIHEAVCEIGARYDDASELALRGAMEDLLEGDAYVRAVKHARQMAQESAGALYDEGWRASASPRGLDELVREYAFTPLELREIIGALEDIEREEDEKGWRENDLWMMADGIVSRCTDSAYQPRWDRMDDELEECRVEYGLTDKQVRTVRKLVEKGLEEVEHRLEAWLGEDE